VVLGINGGQAQPLRVVHPQLQVGLDGGLAEMYTSFIRQPKLPSARCRLLSVKAARISSTSDGICDFIATMCVPPPRVGHTELHVGLAQAGIGPFAGKGVKGVRGQRQARMQAQAAWHAHLTASKTMCMFFLQERWYVHMSAAGDPVPQQAT
jgi:hypothetical protein